MFVKIVFTLDYESGHPLYIDALACFHTKRVRRYMIEDAKSYLLYKLDYLFNPEITNSLEFVGIERIPDREAKKERLECPEFPDTLQIIIWKHRHDAVGQHYEEIERVH